MPFQEDWATGNITESFTFLDYNRSFPYCNGWVFIAFRDKKKVSYVINEDNFVLNSYGDGWFRKAKGTRWPYIGLCIKDIKITSRTPILIGDFICHKCECNYIDYQEDHCKDKFWLFIHKKFELKDVLEYIETYSKEWRP
jgi:hypothetical protein